MAEQQPVEDDKYYRPVKELEQRDLAKLIMQLELIEEAYLEPDTGEGDKFIQGRKRYESVKEDRLGEAIDPEEFEDLIRASLKINRLWERYIQISEELAGHIRAKELNLIFIPEVQQQSVEKIDPIKQKVLRARMSGLSEDYPSAELAEALGVPVEVVKEVDDELGIKVDEKEKTKIEIQSSEIQEALEDLKRRLIQAKKDGKDRKKTAYLIILIARRFPKAMFNDIRKEAFKVYSDFWSAELSPTSNKREINSESTSQKNSGGETHSEPASNY